MVDPFKIKYKKRSIHEINPFPSIFTHFAVPKRSFVLFWFWFEVVVALVAALLGLTSLGRRWFDDC